MVEIWALGWPPNVYITCTDMHTSIICTHVYTLCYCTKCMYVQFHLPQCVNTDPPWWENPISMISIEGGWVKTSPLMEPSLWGRTQRTKWMRWGGLIRECRGERVEGIGSGDWWGRADKEGSCEEGRQWSEGQDGRISGEGGLTEISYCFFFHAILPSMKLFTKQPMQCHIVPTYHIYLYEIEWSISIHTFT